MGRNELSVLDKLPMEPERGVRYDRVVSFRYAEEVTALMPLAVEIKAHDITETALSQDSLNDARLAYGGL